MKMLPALDVTPAMKTLSARLRSWIEYEYVEFRPDGVVVYGGAQVPPNAQRMPQRMPAYHVMNYQPERIQTPPPPRAVFTDPVVLGFDPRHGGTDATNQIWKDPLVRTFWLACKSCFLADQYFNHAMVANAEYARTHPPRIADELGVALSAPTHLFGPASLAFRAKLWPYVVYELQREKRWPYFQIPPSMRVHGSLGWVVRERR